MIYHYRYLRKSRIKKRDNTETTQRKRNKPAASENGHEKASRDGDGLEVRSIDLRKTQAMNFLILSADLC